jgi:hypothetical protein
MKKTEPNPIANCKFQRAVTSIIMFLGVDLSLKKTFAHISEELITILEQDIHSIRAGGTNSVGHQGRRGPTINHLERSRAQR